LAAAKRRAVRSDAKAASVGAAEADGAIASRRRGRRDDRQRETERPESGARRLGSFWVDGVAGCRVLNFLMGSA
jgi:hypothetical protein